MIYFWFTTLFKLVASSFWKKVADLYEQKVGDVFRLPSVLIETPDYMYLNLVIIFHLLNNPVRSCKTVSVK